MRMKIVVPIAALCAVLAAVAFAEMSKPATAPHHPSIGSEMGDMSSLSGKVTETMNGGGYTYVCLEKNGVKTWVAMPQTKVTVGQTLAVQPGQVMQNFRSKTLNRTFDSIVFSGGPAGTGVAPAAQAGAAVGSGPQATPLDKNIKVGKAAGPNAFRISEIYAKRSKLDKKEVTVKGKVVKVSKAIMQRNWVHLQDGSGDQKKGTHELVVTSQDLPAVGDVVTAKGMFAKDKDFGAGYLYPAIIENAKISK
jgi:hypothetical protein